MYIIYGIKNKKHAPLAFVQYVCNPSCVQTIRYDISFHSYMENKQTLPKKKHIQRRNQPKTHKIRFDTTTQYNQENKTVFTSTKLT